MRWRENSLRSFNAAAAAGASFVEFDVQACASSHAYTDVFTLHIMEIVVVCLLQVTADGIPIIWHDDYAVTASQPGAQPVMRRICDMTLQDFKQLLPPPARPGNTAEEDAAELRRGSGAAASCSLECTGGQLARFFNTEEGKPTDAALPWRVSEDDELPTLAEVFEVWHSVGSHPAFILPRSATWAPVPPSAAQCPGPCCCACKAAPGY